MAENLGKACFKTKSGEWGGSATPSAIYRVKAGVVEVWELDLIPFETPIGWHICTKGDSPATCMCACDGQGCAPE